VNNIFREPKKDDKEKLVGVYVPTLDAHRLALYCVLSKKSRTDILKEILNGFFSGIPLHDDLLIELSTQVKERWSDLVKENINDPKWKTKGQIRDNWWDFRRQIKEKLKLKRLDHKTIIRILNKAEEMIKNDQKAK